MPGYGQLTKEARIVSFDESCGEAEDLARNENNNEHLGAQKCLRYECHVP